MAVREGDLTGAAVAGGLSRRTQALLQGAAEHGPRIGWCVLTVESRRENDVDNALAKARIDHWLPLRRDAGNEGGRRHGKAGRQTWSLAWPGYVFVRIMDTGEDWHRVASVKHARTILGTGERPTFFGDEMLLEIKAELAAMKVCPWPAGEAFSKGDSVLVRDGCFVDATGTLVRLVGGGGRGRAVVELMLFGGKVPVEFDLAQLAKRD